MVKCGSYHDRMLKRRGPLPVCFCDHFIKLLFEIMSSIIHPAFLVECGKEGCMSFADIPC